MVEYRHDPLSGQYWLMEVNGRFWGSLPLATAAGADFPTMLADMRIVGMVRNALQATGFDAFKEKFAAAGATTWVMNSRRSTR